MVWRNNFINAKFLVGIYLHLVNRCFLIKFDQLKMLIAENPSLPLIVLHNFPTGWVSTISVLTLAYMCSEGDAEQSSSMSSMDYEARVPPSQELVELETVFHHLVIDVRVKTFESNNDCNKLINLSLYVLSIVLWYYTHLSIICVNLRFWHTYEMHLVFFGKWCDNWCLPCWRPRSVCTVASARQKCFFLRLLDSALDDI
jgi:hypothetical protein